MPYTHEVFKSKHTPTITNNYMLPRSRWGDGAVSPTSCKEVDGVWVGVEAKHESAHQCLPTGTLYQHLSAHLHTQHTSTSVLAYSSATQNLLFQHPLSICSISSSSPLIKKQRVHDQMAWENGTATSCIMQHTTNPSMLQGPLHGSIERESIHSCKRAQSGCHKKANTPKPTLYCSHSSKSI